MKVRHKGNGTIIDLGESWVPEPTEPSETWRDVTGECEVMDDARMCHGMFYVNGNCGYRIRKVRATFPLPGHAFIVEKREP